MSLSRLSGRLNLFLSLNRNYHYPLPTSRNQLEIVVSKDRNLGALDIRYGQLFDFGCRGFTSRCDLNKSTIDNCKGLSLLRGQNTARSWQMLNLRHHYASQAATATEKKSKKMLYYLTGLVFAMVGASYAAVPLYRRFCQATGYGGTVQRRESVEEKIARHAKDGRVASREIAVQFNADVADGMPWKFIPTQREVKVKPGESALAFYTAENRSSAPITGVSTYNVTPMKAAVYFNKIQCFCFEEQRLLPGEQIDMPVFFYIDPEFETDPKMDGINNIILSYTFFKVSDK
ncbi:cytochrome c oxidase assembly protein COX11, mitochondrial isoform X2 [Lycium barbarum]|uniref:cytochrome c oxidase assembly protein COX11, mitochondrial isoform X2 n=1 Tax=Lycium barbarum TaxID=112863 RepID=UPI00293EAB95|nr:cytochrome c oxidase assembly protein COX11, mitochondrial isoform X2 [Lycium barbarum]